MMKSIEQLDFQSIHIWECLIKSMERVILFFLFVEKMLLLLLSRKNYYYYIYMSEFNYFLLWFSGNAGFWFHREWNIFSFGKKVSFGSRYNICMKNTYTFCMNISFKGLQLLFLLVFYLIYISILINQYFAVQIFSPSHSISLICYFSRLTLIVTLQKMKIINSLCTKSRAEKKSDWWSGTKGVRLDVLLYEINFNSPNEILCPQTCVPIVYDSPDYAVSFWYL